MPTTTKPRKSSLLNHLKGINLEQRIVQFKNLSNKKKLIDFGFDPTELKIILSSFPSYHRFNVLHDLVEQLILPKLNPSKQVEVDPNQLKALLMLFPDENRYAALKYIKKHFFIELSDPQMQTLRACLLRDPAFCKLLPFKQKQFLENLLIQRNIKKTISHVEQKYYKNIANVKNQNSKLFIEETNVISLIQKLTEKSLLKSENVFNLSSIERNFETFIKQFSAASENEQFNLVLKLQQGKPELLNQYLAINMNITALFRWIPAKLAQKYLELISISSAIKKARFSWPNIENLVGSDTQTIDLFLEYLANENKFAPMITNIEQLKLLLKMLTSETRFQFLNHPKINSIFKNRTRNMQIKDLKYFIELFPQNDAINFINSSWIKNRINTFSVSNLQFTKHDYKDLLNYFLPEQKEEVKQLLKPICPRINTELLKFEAFKKKVYVKKEISAEPDIVSSHKPLFK